MIRGAPRRDGWALPTVVGMSNFTIEFAIATYGTSVAAVVAAFAAFLAAMVVFNVGVARNYRVRVPVAMSLVFVASVATCYFIQDMPRQSFMRMLLLSVTLLRDAGNQRRDRRAGKVALGARYSADGAACRKRHAVPVETVPGPGVWRNRCDRTGLSDHQLCPVLAIDGHDLRESYYCFDDAGHIGPRRAGGSGGALGDRRASGLLNRGGFEARAAEVLRDTGRQGSQVALVISDLDHFKSINDNFGHAAGDKVIVTFASFLRSAMADHHVAGRIGGEEFAILLPGTNLVAARLFAEGARTAFSSLAVEGLPEGKRVTASFGVAEGAAGEGVAELLARADKALYTAKNSGRDCVKIAERPDKRRGGGLGAAIRL